MKLITIKRILKIFIMNIFDSYGDNKSANLLQKKKKYFQYLKLFNYILLK
jgi:hypothetical protein